MMKELINKEFKGELVAIAGRPCSGQTSLLCSLTKQCLKHNKKVLFISLETGQEILIKKLKYKDISNLQIEDTPIRELSVLADIINNFDGDVVLVDYLQLLPNHKQAIKLLKELSSSKDIPIVVTSLLSREYDDKDLSTLQLSEFKNIDYLTTISDTFTVLYHQCGKEYMVRVIKNSTNENNIIDIRDMF